MFCESYRETLLELDLNHHGRDRVAQALGHLETCPACQAALRDFDGLRNSLALPDRDVEPEGGWTRFEEELVSQITIQSKPLPLLQPLRLAAAVLIALGAFAVGKYLPRGGAPAPIAEKVSTQSATESVSHFTQGDINNEVSAFHQVSQVFDGRAGWVLLSNGASGVGVAERNIETAKELLLLRLTILSGERKVSEADLIVIPGQTAKLSVPLGQEAVLHYRVGTSADEPDNLTLWAEIRTAAGTEPLAALSTRLQLQPGQKLTAGDLSTTSGRYVLKVAFARAALPSEGRP